MAPNLNDALEPWTDKSQKRLVQPAGSAPHGASVLVSASVLLHLKLTRLGLCPTSALPVKAPASAKPELAPPKRPG